MLIDLRLGVLRWVLLYWIASNRRNLIKRFDITCYCTIGDSYLDVFNCYFTASS